MTTGTPKSRSPAAALLAVVLGSACAGAAAATPRDLLADYSARASGSADPARGRAFFTTAHGRDWACASCHGPTPVSDGRHAATGKAIRPLAPSADPARFTDRDKVEKWFRRNCADVVGRACTDAEKADVLAWLITLNR